MSTTDTHPSVRRVAAPRFDHQPWVDDSCAELMAHQRHLSPGAFRPSTTSWKAVVAREMTDGFTAGVLFVLASQALVLTLLGVLLVVLVDARF